MIKELPEQFTGIGEVKGFEFNRFDSNAKAYIYKVQQPNDSKHYFEVFKRKTTPICIDFSQRIYSDTDSKEVYPKGEAFGHWAWTTQSEDKAYEYLNRMTINK